MGRPEPGTLVAGIAPAQRSSDFPFEFPRQRHRDHTHRSA
jgi:hypothetical protein